MPFSNAYRDRMLQLAADAAHTVHLLCGSARPTDATYKGQRVQMVVKGGQAENDHVINFGPYASGFRAAVTGWALYDAQGAEIARGEIEARKPEQAERSVFEPGDLVLRLET